MNKVEFITESSGRGANPEISSERLVNCYPEPAPSGARGRYVLRAAEGYSATPFADLVREVYRAHVVSQGELFIAARGRLYKVDAAGTVSDLTFIEDAPDTTMAALNGSVAVTANGRFYVWDGAAKVEPEDGAYLGAGSVTSLNSRLITSEPDGRKYDWSELNAPAERDALNFASKEAREDRILQVLAFEDNVWLFGVTSIEVAYDTGVSDDQFRRIPNAVHEHGIKARGLATAFQDNLFYIGSDNIFYRANGVQPVGVSTPAVIEAIEAETPSNVFGYVARGHRFVTIRFAQRPAWTYDMDSGLWWERSTGGVDEPWEVADTAFAYGKWLAITKDGRVYAFEDTKTDGAQTMIRLAGSRPLDLTGIWSSMTGLEFRVQAGAEGLDRPESFLFRYSRDGGNTWSRWQRRELGGKGRHERRSVIKGLGAFLNFTCQVSISDPIQMELESDALMVTG